MSLMRLIKTIAGQIETYEASFECSKPLNEVLEVVRHFREKQDFWLGPHGVLKEVKNFGYYDIGKGPQGLMVSNPKILWHFTVMYMNGVAYQIKVRLETCCPKIVFEEFKALIEKLPDVESQGVAEEEIPQVDYSGKTILELENLFDEACGKFLDAPSVSTFTPMKDIKAELGKRIKELPLDKRGELSQPMSQIDLYMNTIDMQISNPVMAMQISSFAGTYVSQIQAQLPSLLSAINNLPQDVLSAVAKAPATDTQAEEKESAAASKGSCDIKTKACVNCGAINLKNAVYCSTCGKSVDGTQIPSAISNVEDSQPQNKVITTGSVISIVAAALSMLFLLISGGNAMPGPVVLSIVSSVLGLGSSVVTCIEAFGKNEQASVKILSVATVVFALGILVACISYHTCISNVMPPMLIM